MMGEIKQSETVDILFDTKIMFIGYVIDFKF